MPTVTHRHQYYSAYLLRSSDRASFLQSMVIVGVGGVSCSSCRGGSGAGCGRGGLQMSGHILGDPFNPSPLCPIRFEYIS